MRAGSAPFFLQPRHASHRAVNIRRAVTSDCSALTALMHAKGIRAMPVLIHTANIFDLPDTVLLGAFNHVITYLPDWDLFVDSTSGSAPFGVLPPGVRAKQALLGGDKALKPVVRVTPAANAAKDRLIQRTSATLTADGSVSGTNRIEALGAVEAVIRGSLGAITETTRPAVAQRLLSASGQTGEATLNVSDARDLNVPFSFVFEFRTPQRVNVPGPGALPTSFGMPSPSGAQSFSASVLQLDRKLDFPCPTDGTEEQLELTLPAQVKITSLPKAESIESPYGRFVATYTVKDQQLVVNRRLDLTPPRAVCTAADTAELRKFATAISQAMRAQILYE
jgi:hypothetical protein